MGNASKAEQVLDSLGLWSAIKGFPGLLAPILVSIAFLELAASQISGVASSVPQGSEHFLAVVIGSLMGLLGYFSGNFWDDVIFDPLYSTSGRWLVDRRPLRIFPAGSDLKGYREKARDSKLPKRFEGESVYKRAKRFVEKKPGLWKEIEKPLILSKFVRSFFWPCILVLAGGVFGAAGVRIFSWAFNPNDLLVIGIAAALIGLSLTVPYLHLRVDHLIRLYDRALEEVESET